MESYKKKIPYGDSFDKKKSDISKSGSGGSIYVILHIFLIIFLSLPITSSRQY